MIGPVTGRASSDLTAAEEKHTLTLLVVTMSLCAVERHRRPSHRDEGPTQLPRTQPHFAGSFFACSLRLHPLPIRRLR
jgi:hypothetical protein